MNIRITVRSLLLEVRPAVSIVLKPAVLAVTELKRDENIFSETLMPAIRLSFSKT